MGRTTWHRPIDVAVMEATHMTDEELAQALPELKAQVELEDGYLMTKFRIGQLEQRLNT